MKNIEKINAVIKEKDFHGVITIKKGKEIAYEKAIGFLDRANEIPNNRSTKFGIASGTKLFTALAIFKLIDEGKLSLNSKAFDYVDYTYETYDKNVTIAQLLSHTSGIPDYLDEEEIEDYDNFTLSKPWQEFFDPKDYFDIMPIKAMVYEPGTNFIYNNSGFVFLAAIVAKISGMRYVDYLTEKIFKANNMEDSGFYPLNSLPKNTANGYILEDIGYRTNIYNLPIVGGGDGGAYTSARDMYKLWNAILDGKVIDSNLFRTMMTPVAKEINEGENTFYGYGMWLEGKLEDGVSLNGKIVGNNKVKISQIYIEGCDAGVSFRSGVIEDKDITYSILSNTTFGVWDVLDEVLDLK